VSTNLTRELQELEFNTTYEIPIVQKTSKHSIAIVGFSIPNIATPLFDYGPDDPLIVTRGIANSPSPTSAFTSVTISGQGTCTYVDYGLGPNTVVSYYQIVRRINEAFAAANTGSGHSNPVMTYDSKSNLFSIEIDPDETQQYFFSRSLVNRFPTFAYEYGIGLDVTFGLINFNSGGGLPYQAIQENVALWALHDFNRIVVTAPTLPIESTQSAVSGFGNPSGIRTLASFENSDVGFNRSAFIYSESGLGNWTLHDFKTSVEISAITLKFYAVNLRNQFRPIVLTPGSSALIKLAFVEDTLVYGQNL
jgi:hypothetical protein